MSGQQLTRALIEEWAYSDIVIDAYESGDDGDAACFEIAVFEFFGVKGLLDFAADPACLARLYFVGLLAKTFLWMFRNNAGLPFHFSRFLGIMSREDYRRMNEEREEKIYEICLVLDSMRSIKDPAIQSLYKQILDFRHDQVSSSSEFYSQCSKNLDLSLFSPNLT